MKHPFLTLKSYLLLLVLIIVCTPGWSQGITDQPTGNYDWASYRDMNQTTYQKRLTEMRRKGMRPVDVEIMGGNTRTYAAVFRQNTDQRMWELKTGLTSEQYNTKWKEMKNKGFRPVDQESHLLRGKRYYGALWIKNIENYKWVSFRNLSSSDYSKRFQEYKGKGYMPVDVDAYKVGNEIRYSVIWIENKQGKQWAQYRNLTASQFGARFQEMNNKGYRLLDTESYQNGRTQLYAAVWIKERMQWKAYRDMTAIQFGNKWGAFRDEGYRLEDIEIYSTPQGTRYAGVWVMNKDRYMWSKKDLITTKAKRFQRDNPSRGMSIAIAQNGKIKYLKGFGLANQDNGKEVNGHTIYRMASVSKAITGVLAFKLQAQGKFDVDQKTRKYEEGLPDHHTHTITQLLSNRGRVRGYTSGRDPLIHGTNSPVADALAGSMLFANDPLVRLPRDSFYVYSTHGYTLVAAAMEKSREMSFNDILREELSSPYQLPTLRCEDHLDLGPKHSKIYERLRDGRFGTLRRKSLSWKYAGGGMECSAYDLARFGMQLVDRRILSQDDIDEMLSVPDDDSDYANGWIVGTRKGNKYYSKGGSQPGSRAYIICVPEKKLVVAVMCNTKVGGIHSFGKELAEASW
ncbi:MAG: serine hydrolase [Saprospiraceae bacterium]|nr:serine hydrolase [Saprospiraceae bacterium]